MKEVEDVLSTVSTSVPHNNMTYLFEYLGINTPAWLGGNCSYWVKEAVQRCLARGIKAYPVRPTEGALHDSMIVEDRDGEKCFADPTYLLNCPVPLKRIFDEGEVEVKTGSFSKQDVGSTITLTANGANCFNFCRRMPHGTASYSYDVTTISPDTRVLNGGDDVEAREAFKTTLVYQVSTGRVLYDLYEEAEQPFAVNVPGGQKIALDSSSSEGMDLYRRICATAGADPDLLMKYFEIAARTERDIIRALYA